MANNIGYFKHYEIPPSVQREDAQYNTSFSQQEYSGYTGLIDDLIPFDLASFEEYAYNTNNPKRLLRTDMFDLVNGGDSVSDVHRMTRLGIVSTVVSDDLGVFPQELKISVDFGNFYSFSELKITSRTIIPIIKIVKYYGDLENLETTTHTPSSYSKTENNFFELYYDVNISSTNKIDIIFTEIEAPYHFLWVSELQVGKVNIFDEKNLINVESKDVAHIYTENLEYNTLDLSVFDENNSSFGLISQSQLIEHWNIGNDGVKSVDGEFYISNTTTDENILNLTAYNAISTFEDTVMGGIYQNATVKSLIDKLFNGLGIEYEVDSELESVTVTGHIPITTRREALRLVLVGSNTFCYEENGVFYFTKKITSIISSLTYNKTNIIQNPLISKSPPLRYANIKCHSFSQGSEYKEIYNETFESGEQKRIFFDTPVYNLKAYEVTENSEGDLIVSDTTTNKIEFITKHANYCVIKATTSGRYCLKGVFYIDETIDTTTYGEVSPRNTLSSVYELETTLYSNPETLSQEIFERKNAKKTINFITLDKPQFNKLYNILGDVYYIKSVVNTYNGLYEIEAVQL